ncbi:hypothetical protein VNI00_011879 [Paramarasmius palmivorus]|uniref:Enoyl reductase (ER) domain-containing protein n=1 Tax=Paramarasmius palmivorus TaxID=297713 RepID=A0AAW0CAR5_9AGAR
MKAIVTKRGGTYQLEDVEIPIPRNGEVLVKVECAAQNPTDWKSLSMIPEGHIIGFDFSGTIQTLGPGVNKESRHAGQRVAGTVHGGAERNGAFAEFVLAQAELLFTLPDSISFEEGAQVGCACMTAYMSLYDTLMLPTPFDTPSTTPSSLLVWSGATSVGQIVIQLAKLSGLRVIATASPRNQDFVRSLGADEVYDYLDSFTGRDIFEATGGGIHYAVDCWGEGTSPYQVSASLSNDHATVATLLPYKSRKKGIETKFVFTYSIFGKETVFPFPSPVDMEMVRKARHYCKLISQLLSEGKVKLGPVKLFPNGLVGVADGMDYARLGKSGGVATQSIILESPAHQLPQNFPLDTSQRLFDEHSRAPQA